MKKNFSLEIINILRRELPQMFRRADVDKHLYGLYSSATLARLECDKTGPPIHKMGKSVFYIRDEFCDWLERYYNSGGLPAKSGGDGSVEGFDTGVQGSDRTAQGAGQAE